MLEPTSAGQLIVSGGMPVGDDGRVHTSFTHNPSSLRLSSREPNLQNIPRGNDSEYAKWVKQCFVAGRGNFFWERDFSAIEAVLVGYFAADPSYIRFAKLGVHAYLAANILNIKVDLGQTDKQLKTLFSDLKSREKVIYDTAKRIVHGSNYMMTPHKMWIEYPETFKNVRAAAELQEVYHSLFPSIRKWHRQLCDSVDGTKVRPGRDQSSTIDVDPWTLGVCFAKNPFGYVHRFYNVLDWNKVNGEWFSSFGEDAKRLVSFLPQSTAAAIIKQKGKQLYYDHPEVGRTMRLWIHDSILGEDKEEFIADDLACSQAVMESPIKELPLPPSWNMGEYLAIGTEGKVGKTWATMQ